MGHEGTIDFSTLVLMNQESLENDQDMVITMDDLTGKSEADAAEMAKSEDKVIETPKEGEIVENTIKPEDIKIEDLKPKGNNFSSIAKKFIEKGDWEDGIIEVGGKEIKLSEAEDLDEETFYSILEEQKETSKEDQKKNYISVKDVDEDKQRIINILKSGGDLKEIFQSESQMRKPYEGVDLDKEQNLQSIYYSQLLRQNIDEEDAKALVIKATTDLTLDTKAKSIVDAYQKHYSENLKKLEADTLKAAQEDRESAKEYKKSLNKFYKDEGIDDSLSKILTEAGTKVDSETGQLYIDTVYEKLMEDPEKAKDLIFFMLEKEKFLAAKGVKIKTEVEMNNLKKFRLIRETAKTSTAKTEEVEEKKDKSVFGDIVLED